MSAPFDRGRIPSAEQAADLAALMLSGIGTRLPHVLRAGGVAASLAPLFDEHEARLLVAAATLHDIGYAPQIAHTGFHSLDGANHLVALGFHRRLASLVAHHSEARLNAPDHGIHDLEMRFERETGLLTDALVYADMHAAPDGRRIRVEDRLRDIAARHSYPATRRRLDLLREAIQRVTQAAAAAGLESGPTTADIRDGLGQLPVPRPVSTSTSLPPSRGRGTVPA